ncbi:MAG TPA: PAS domain S-box protein, partial [Gemmatimonadaceae bacterium]|nr:PAS domain S-box protein [Gemmatimonadaceae bacterium]
MSSRTRERELTGVVDPLGDRQLAGFLSALAEAPDIASAASFLLAQAVELAGAARGLVLRIDAVQDALAVAASHGISEDVPAFGPSLTELSNPLVLSVLAMSSAAGEGSLDLPAFEHGPWVAVPLSQPRSRSAPAFIPLQQATELALACGVRLLAPLERRLGTAPAGIMVIAGDVAPDTLDAIALMASLASPIVARIAALGEALEQNERLVRQKDRLKLMVDSLPDPVVITNASNDIIAQNERAERLLNAREGDSAGRRRAIELNNLLFTSFLARAVMSSGTPTAAPSGPRELNLVDPDEGTDLLFEVLAHPLGERVGPEDAVLSVLRDVTDLRRASFELERQVQRVRLAEQKASGERDRLNLILENVADPILVTDQRSNIILMNDQAERLFQAAGGAQDRREIQAVQGNDTKFTSFISEFALLDANARRERMTLVHPRTGHELPVEVVSGKIRNERGEPIAIVSVLHDLTKEVEIERLYETLKRLNSELEERIREATADLAEQNARLQWQSQEV